MIKCQSRITKTYKKAKADCMWPESVYGPVPEALLYPECGGDVKLSLYLSQGCCCHESSELEIMSECSRCKNPYYPHKLEERNSITYIEELLNR